MTGSWRVLQTVTVFVTLVTLWSHTPEKMLTILMMYQYRRLLFRFTINVHNKGLVELSNFTNKR